MTIPTVASIEERSHPAYLVMAVSAVCLVVLFGTVYQYGLAARVAAERSEVALVQQENHDFCTGLGLADKSDAYARCTGGLTAIRLRQRERFDAESAGIL